MGLRSGRIMAVKIIPVEEGQEKNLKEKAKQEVETIARLCHVSLSFSSALGYLLIVMDRHTSLSLCIRKVGKWESRFRYLCPLPTVLCETIQVRKWTRMELFLYHRCFTIPA